MRHPLKIVLMALVLGLFLVPLSDAVAHNLINQDPYNLETIEPQTIPLWGQRTWAKTDVTVIINAGNGVTDEAIAEVERSVDDWNRAIHAGLGGTSPFHLVLITEGKADITIRPKSGGGAVQGMALCKDDGNGFFTNCKLNVSGKAFGSANPADTVLSISLQELGHALGFLHSDNNKDVMYGTLQEDPNTVISTCDIDAWEAAMHWLVTDGLAPADAHPAHVGSVSCGDAAPPPAPDPDPTRVVAHVDSTTPFTVGGKKELRFTEEIQDADGNPVAEASVSVQLTLPDGSVLRGMARTGADGKITFRLRQKAKDGPYTIEVTNVEKDELIYDKCGTSDPTPPDESKKTFELSGGEVVSETVVDDCA